MVPEINININISIKTERVVVVPGWGIDPALIIDHSLSDTRGKPLPLKCHILLFTRTIPHFFLFPLI